MLIDSAAYYLSLFQLYFFLTLLFFIFPMVMWRSYLKGKGAEFRFLFCVLTQSCFVANLVLLLGFLKIANRWTLLLGFAVEYAVVRWKTHGLMQTIAPPKPKYPLQHPITRKDCIGYVKHELWNIRLRLSKYRDWPIWDWLRRHWLILLFLSGILVYNCLFLNHNMLTDGHSYQVSDSPVHTSWVYELDHGTLFSAGIYPFYMHATIYAAKVLSGLHLREVVLYYGPYQTLMLIICMYCVSRKVFSNDYVALFPLVMFSLLMNNGRYASTLPQECGVFSEMALAYFMSSYLHSDRPRHTLVSDSRRKRLFRINQFWFRRYMTIDLFMIAICVGNVIGFHFYTAIAAIVLVMAFAAAYLPRVLNKHYWVPLLTSGIMGVIIAVTPFIAGLAQGIPFQGSMNWAMSLINGETWENEEYASYEDLINGVEEEDTTEPDITEVDTPAPVETEVEEPRRSISLRDVYLALADTALSSVPPGGKVTEYGTFGLIGFAVVVSMVTAFFRKLRWIGVDYFVLALYCLGMLFMGSTTAFGMTLLMERQRIPVFIQPFVFILAAVPVDVLCRLVTRLVKGRKGFVLSRLSATSACAALMALCIATGTVHDYLGRHLTYYNEAEYVLKTLRREFPAKSFTVVSPTDDFYGVVDEGYHTELSQLVSMIEGNYEEYVLPTEYVFVFVEKRMNQDRNYTEVSVDPEFAKKRFIFTGSMQDYSYQRAVMESKAYYWAQCMLEAYPDAFSVYFEDDIFVVYLLHQNPYYPYDLRLDFSSCVEQAIKNKSSEQPSQP